MRERMTQAIYMIRRVGHWTLVAVLSLLALATAITLASPLLQLFGFDI